MEGVGFIEYATSKPQAFGRVLEMMGSRPVARITRIRSCCMREAVSM
jgi:4-hydroxyphenylpyruvate dioxygenase-like putative hemolysin